ncbi:hypothetical protein [Nonomuraea gerenzanensis]|uniref:Uncharacterized protein n=1 Tax=Nonomuraea gerenzanensis TaxID=93944 RepID=A0A1M4DZ55_9ACTN|nr:hypothetical protein [Nonomuraea gerenzanensis]UBU14145.1 hypothetical protein LCN96_03675 [Nonomuraea gerenzanensis]SBO91834.1 hypothetical protein BN4615_P1348 [Nonomuraea gerenzanensis]
MIRVALRVVGFELKGLTAIGLWALRRNQGVPRGATVVPYAKEQAFVLLLFGFAMAVETVVIDLLLVALDVPAWLRYGVLVADLYGLLFVAVMAAGCATRPHVVTREELRVRYGIYFELRVPRELITAVRTRRVYDEGGMVTVKDDRLTVAVSSQTNVTVELARPVTVVRPLGRRAEVRSIRFFADSPEIVAAALRAEEPTHS